MKKLVFSMLVISFLLSAVYCCGEVGVVSCSAEQYKYDALERVVVVLYDDGSAEKYEYDASGNIVRVEELTVEEAKKVVEETSKNDNPIPGIPSAKDSSGSGAPSGIPSSDEGQNDSTVDISTPSKDANEKESNISSSDAGKDSDSSKSSDIVITEDDTSSDASDDTDKVSNSVKKGQKYIIGDLIYRIVSTKSKFRKVSVVGVKKTRRKKSRYIIPMRVKIKGKSYMVTQIGKKAFTKCKRCRVIHIKSTTIVSIHKTAFKRMKKRLKFKVPKRKYKKYKKLLKKCKGYKHMRTIVI